MMEGISSLPAISVYTTGVYLSASERDATSPGAVGARVIASTWKDGTVVCSEDSAKGGGPHLMGKVSFERVTEILAAACQKASALPSGTRTDYRVPGSSWTSIVINSEICRVNSQSWHDIADASGNHLCVDGAIRPLRTGETIEEARAESSPGYLAFLESWGAVKESVLEPMAELQAQLSGP